MENAAVVQWGLRLLDAGPTGERRGAKWQSSAGLKRPDSVKRVIILNCRLIRMLALRTILSFCQNPFFALKKYI